MLKKLRRAVGRALTWCVRGPQFKRWARPSPAAEAGPRLRVAVCYLIPLLGDTVMLFPLLDALQREHPEAEITAFVNGVGRVLGKHPAVGRLVEVPFKANAGSRLWPASYVVKLWWWWRRELRDLRFDVCVSLRGGSDPFYSTHLMWLLGGRERVGYSAKVEPERAPQDLDAEPLLTRVVMELKGVREVERGAEVMRLAGLIHGAVDGDAVVESVAALARSEEGRRFVEAHGELRRPYFVVSPGASVALKEWPEEEYAEVAARWSGEGLLAVFVGGAEVAEKCERIAGTLPGAALNLAGRTSFVELVAVCAGAKFFVGNDSGTGHVAGACGTPVVILSSYSLASPVVHQTSPARTRPVGPYSEMVQPERQLAPCKDECLSEEAHCIRQITAEQVLEAQRRLMERVGRG